MKMKKRMEPPGQARGTWKTRLRPSGFGEVRPTQKMFKRHLAEVEDAFISGQGRGLLRRRTNLTGLTLVEMLVVSTLIGIFSVFLVNLIMTSQNALVIQHTAVPARMEAKQTMEAMVKELRAGDPSAAGGVTITGSQITFSIPNTVSQSGIQSWRQVQYALDSAAKEVTRTEGAGTTVLGRNIDLLQFTKVNNVVTVTVRATKTAAGGTTNINSTLTSQVTLRN